MNVSNPNTMKKIQDVDKVKEKAKEEAIKKLGKLFAHYDSDVIVNSL